MSKREGKTCPERGKRRRWKGSAIVWLAVMAAVAAGCRPLRWNGHERIDLANPPPIGKPATAFAIPPASERVLPNGLTLLAVEYHAVPIVVFHLLIAGGAAYDPAGKEGVAALTADLIRQGTDRRSAEELAREIEFLGGGLAGDAGRDFSMVSGEFLSKDIDAGLDLFADVALHPAFRPDEFRRAQGLALAGIVAARENASAIADRCFQAYLYGGHPYGHPSEGDERTVRRLTVADVRNFYTHHYDPRGAVLVVIGDASVADLATKVERAFAGWQPGGGAAPTLAPPTRVRGRNLLLVDKADAKQTHLRIGNTAIGRSDPDYVPAGVTSTILGGGLGSRLIDELRVKRSLTYGAWSVFAARRVLGDFRVGTFTKVETTGEALGLTLDMLRRYADDGATPDELARSQSLLTGQYPRQLETPGALAARLAELQAYGLPRSDLATYPERVTATSLEDVRRIAKRWMPTDDAAIVVVGPAASLGSELAAFGPVTRTTPEECDRPGAPSAARYE